MAYSAIAHAGYVLTGILCLNESGYAGAVFYALAYLVMNFICFLVVIKVADQGQDLQIAQLAGLHRRSPLLAMALLLGFFSLGGIPPTIGFTGKFLVFLAAMGKGYFYLVLIGMINVVLSLYYYALVIKAAYFLEPQEDLPKISLSWPVRMLTVGHDHHHCRRRHFPRLSFCPGLGSGPVTGMKMNIVLCSLEKR